jgi:hypothetical protein
MDGRPFRAFLIAALVFGLLALIPLWRPVLLGHAFVPAGMQRGIAPWSEGEGPPGVAWDVLRWDSIAQFYPWREYLFRNLREGHVPLWNRHELLGTPFLGNSQSAVFYPLHWLVAPMGPVRGMSTSALLHLLWAGLGAYVLCRRLGCGFWAALVAGGTFELSQWMIAWLQLPSVPMTTSWIPWVLAAVHRVWDEPDFGATVRLGLCGGMMLLAGHLQIATYGFLSALLLVVWLAVASGRTRRAGGLAISAAGLVLCVAIAAVQFLPAYELGRLSHRANVPTEDGYRFYTALALPPAQIGMVVAPYYSGDPAYGSYWSQARVEGAYWGEEPLPEYASYVGLVALVLAAYAVARWRECRSGWFYVVLGGLAWLLALGTPVNRLLYFAIPGWSSTGSPARVLCVAALAAAVLAGLGMQRMREDEAAEMRLRWRWAIQAAALAAALGCFVALLTAFVLPSDVPAPSYRWAIALGTMIVLAPGFGLNVITPPSRPGAAYNSAAIALLQALTLVVFAARYNASSPAGDVYPAFEGLEVLRAASPYRVAVINERWARHDYPSQAVLPPNSALAYGFDEVGGYDSLVLKATKERVLDPVNRRDSAPVENGNMMFVRPSALAGGRLRGLGVRYVVTRGEVVVPAELQPVTPAGGAIRAYEYAGPAPLALLETQGGRHVPGELAWAGPNRFGLAFPQNGGAGQVTVRVIAAPGWHLLSAGRESSFTAGDGPWLSGPVDGSAAPITARYEPATYRLGLFLSLLALSVAAFHGSERLVRSLRGEKQQAAQAR